MKAYSYLMVAFTGALLFSSPAHALRLMKFKGEVEIGKNTGLSTRESYAPIFEGKIGKRYDEGCLVKVSMAPGTEVYFPKDREVVVGRNSKENNEGSLEFYDPSTGMTLGTIKCFNTSNEESVIKELERHLGLEIVDKQIKRVPIKYDAQTQEKIQDERPRLIQPLHEQDVKQAEMAIEI